MKHLSLVAVFLTVMGPLCAQTANGDPYNSADRTSLLFNNPAPGKLPVKFHYYFPRGNQLVVEMSNPLQAGRIPDIDSVIRAAWQLLQPFADSLQDQLASRRVDVVSSRTETTIRLLTYPQRETVFRLRGTDTAQVKVEMDTLRIVMQVPVGIPDALRRKAEKLGQEVPVSWTQPLVLLLLLNQLPDMNRLSTADLFWVQQSLKTATDSLRRRKNGSFSRHTLHFNVDRRQQRPSQVRYYSHRSAPLPALETGLQFARGSFVPSAGVGLMLEWRPKPRPDADRTINTYRLLWEPLFFFGRSADGKTTLDRNDFVTFKYSGRDEDPKNDRKWRYYETVSIGYQIRHRGPWLQPRTIKVGLPGVETWRFRLEPEFLFNDLFRNFSPSLKATIVFE